MQRRPRMKASTISVGPSVRNLHMLENIEHVQIEDILAEEK